MSAPRAPGAGVFARPSGPQTSVSAMAENAVDDLNSNLLHAPYLTGDPQLDTAIEQWLRWDKVGTWSPRHLSPLLAHPLPVRPFRYPPRSRQAPGEMAPASAGLVELGDTSHLCRGCFPRAIWAGQGQLQSLSFVVGYTPQPRFLLPCCPFSSSAYHLSLSKILHPHPHHCKLCSVYYESISSFSLDFLLCRT